MALALGLAATLLGAPASEPARVGIEWQGGACDQAGRAAARLDELLPPHELGPTGRARVHVVPDDSTQEGGDAQWVATVEIETADGTVTRTLRGGPCSSIADAIALVVAVTVDPLGASTRVDAWPPTRPGGTDTPEPVGTIPQAPEPVARTTDLRPASAVVVAEDPSPDLDRAGRGMRRGPRSAVASSARRRPAISTALVVDGGGAIGLLPRIGGRLGGSFVIGLGAGRIAVTGLHVFGRRTEHPQDESAGADVALSAARLSGGWSFRTGRFTFPLCAGIEAGAFTAAGFGLSDAGTARAVWVGLVPHAQPTLWATPWLGLGLHVEAPIALLRPRFDIDDFEDDLVRIGPVGLRFGLSIEVRFFDEDRGSRRTGRGSG